MRALRIAASVQVPLPLDAGRPRPEDLWPSLPDAARVQVLALLARLISKGVLVEEETAS